MSSKQSFCSFKYTKMNIRYGIDSCDLDDVAEKTMFMQRGKYMLVGWADMHSQQPAPVWRKVG